MNKDNEVVSASPMTPLVVSSAPRRLGDRRRATHGTPIDLGALVGLIPEIGEMLHRDGELVRIVGSKQLLDGIRDNTLHYMQGSLGHMTAAVDEHGRIVGHVRLQRPHRFELVQSAAAIFQIASAVTLQYYLQRFDDQLGEISESVHAAREHAAWAQVQRAVFETAEIAEMLETEGDLTADQRARLDAEERAVDVVVLQELQPVSEAVDRLRAVRDEIDELLGQHSVRSRFARSASAVRETLPGGMRHHLQHALEALDAAMPDWCIAARAAQVHASLRTLRAVADRVYGRIEGVAAADGLIERAAALAALSRDVAALLDLPAETYALFTIDSPIGSRIETLRTWTTWLARESATAAERLGIAAEHPTDELTLGVSHGNVVAFPKSNVA